MSHTLFGVLLKAPTPGVELLHQTLSLHFFKQLLVLVVEEKLENLIPKGSKIRQQTKRTPNGLFLKSHYFGGLDSCFCMLGVGTTTI